MFDSTPTPEPAAYVVPVTALLVVCPRCEHTLLLPLIPAELSEEERYQAIEAGIDTTPGVIKKVPDVVGCPNCKLALGIIPPRPPSPPHDNCFAP